MKSTSKFLILLSVCLVMFLSTSAQNTIYVLNYYKSNYLFSSGFWVYQDVATQETDSITLDNVKHGFYGPNPVILDYREYYQLEYYSHTHDSAFNDFFMENLWRVNGGGQYGELGQPVMLANYNGPLMGGYNGFEILEILDSLVVGNNVFYDVARSHVYENQQYQHEFDFDMDLYYADGTGIVRKAYFDDDSVYHSWDLVNWEVGYMVDVIENSSHSPNPCVFPNPTSGKFRVYSEKPFRASICNLQGDVLMKTDRPDVDITNLADGIYLVRIYSPDGSSLKAEKIVKQ